MKKLFAMVVLLLSTLGLGAQSLGIKGGLGYSTLNGGQMSRYKRTWDLLCRRFR
ncbi:hypothetical protein [Porphyromonas catoniae]|uniref:hypothetical protein n=1 Tax=Porphyromonas catoniae TaxID=41976 RepID=UPI0028D33029|nr:hypothetical protein [Porphyromonas catoniae]